MVQSTPFNLTIFIPIHLNAVHNDSHEPVVHEWMCKDHSRFNRWRKQEAWDDVTKCFLFTSRNFNNFKCLSILECKTCKKLYYAGIVWPPLISNKWLPMQTNYCCHLMVTWAPGNTWYASTKNLRNLLAVEHYWLVSLLMKLLTGTDNCTLPSCGGFWSHNYYKYFLTWQDTLFVIGAGLAMYSVLAISSLVNSGFCTNFTSFSQRFFSSF